MKQEKLFTQSKNNNWGKLTLMEKINDVEVGKNLSLILIVVFLCVFPAFAEEKSLTIWLMPNEPSQNHEL